MTPATTPAAPPSSCAEGPRAIDGRRTVLVDDVVRSGGQLLHMARILRIVGGPVAHALCVLERPLGGRALLADHRVTLHSLLTEADLPVSRSGGAV
ncbi:phosphoribosyltransferase family protein [Kitasatospora purpeofusca]|uniref:phosphoribosyltransferase family protein n=1 Tax=Kitasatospora purpeofusca TaxID=67352 RepID=UPI0036D2384D